MPLYFRAKPGSKVHRIIPVRETPELRSGEEPSALPAIACSLDENLILRRIVYDILKKFLAIGKQDLVWRLSLLKYSFVSTKSTASGFLCVQISTLNRTKEFEVRKEKFSEYKLRVGIRIVITELSPLFIEEDVSSREPIAALVFLRGLILIKNSRGPSGIVSRGFNQSKVPTHLSRSILVHFARINERQKVTSKDSLKSFVATDKDLFS
uniref:Uncharacterized protein n=1 Tax=Vespula pensylvanica TaxID=30213 RepID=A0A834P6V1_VESPE|nr:hypothetical protein H0235_004203 [Vespula pensylvanica]